MLIASIISSALMKFTDQAINTLFLDLFQRRYGESWLGVYNLAKTSVNNIGNEMRSFERRSGRESQNNDLSGNLASSEENEDN